MSDFAISADGVPIHYEVHGDGQTALIFVHGGGGNRSLWEKQAGYFAQRYKVVKAPIVAINSDFHSNDIESAQKYGVEIIVMSGVDHFLMMEDAENFNLLLEATVNRFVHQ